MEKLVLGSIAYSDLCTLLFVSRPTSAMTSQERQLAMDKAMKQMSHKVRGFIAEALKDSESDGKSLQRSITPQRNPSTICINVRYTSMNYSRFARSSPSPGPSSLRSHPSSAKSSRPSSAKSSQMGSARTHCGRMLPSSGVHSHVREAFTADNEVKKTNKDVDESLAKLAQTVEVPHQGIRTVLSYFICFAYYNVPHHFR